MKAHVKAIVDFLKSEGWEVLVVHEGGRVEQRGDRKYNCRFVVDFTGVKNSDDD